MLKDAPVFNTGNYTADGSFTLGMPGKLGLSILYLQREECGFCALIPPNLV